MRPLLLAVAAGLAVSGHDLATDYGRERTLTTTAELELDLETTSFEMLVDDQPVEDARGGGGSSSSLVRKCVIADHVLEGERGAPKRVQRTFETLRDESTSSFGEDERSDERDYPLQGVTLELSLDEEGEVRSELVEGPKPDDESLLEGHELALALDAFLPEGGSAELEATWELDDAALKRALASALDARLFALPAPEEGAPRGEGEGGRGRGFGRGRGGPGRTLGFVEWQGKATLAALDEEHDGLACARIALELEGSGELPEPSFRGGGRGFLLEPASAAASAAGTVEARLAGDLFVSLEQRRPVALKLDGTLTTENSFEREREGRRFSSRSTQEGPLTLTIRIQEQ